MGLSGLWAQRTAQDYTGARRWGNGVNPIHEVRDNGRGRVVGAKETQLGEPADVVAQDLTAREIDWLCEDPGAEPVEGETFRYQDERPDWGQVTTQFRADSNGPAMGQQEAWGNFFDDDPTGMFPNPGPTAGMQRWLDVFHGESVERQHAIAVPTRGVSGGWLGKVRGEQAQPESQDAGQDGFVWTINNATVQGPGRKELTNDRAVARGTDSPRSSILSRTAGMRDRAYALSFGMGGGPGTPDMQPFQQSPGLKRPWVTRTAALPPPEEHTFNEMEGRVAIARSMAPDPYPGDPEAGPGDTAASDWGY